MTGLLSCIVFGGSQACMDALSNICIKALLMLVGWVRQRNNEPTMMGEPVSSVRNRLIAAAAVLGLGSGVLTGCGNDDPVNDVVPGTTDMTTTTTKPDQPQYFANADHVGKKATITAPVENDLTDESVILDAASYGDDSLLVLFKGDQPEFTEGRTMTVTGTVRQFSYDDYAERYGLGEAALFDAYANEEFLEAESMSTSSPAPTS
ncbi:hypothetical protein [Lentzea sp. NEAU-D7]|uniref:hypothetical protein n=1 Tax=Lentzea sp. NEAU-D7 TaxID=2994667 RepID=UPI00224B96BA|nr:hypothetical protein [Lentzea sp. NEAU-D7]MCX2948871.1 hypothetical protein [Lentzea sp. NEAU-D7]